MSKQNYVFVLDTKHKPLTPCTPEMASSLLKAGKAAVFRLTIILKKQVQDEPKTLALKLDPGSKTTGMALWAASEADNLWQREPERKQSRGLNL